MNNLSEDIFNKIMLYNSHPVADIVKNSHKFKYKRLRLDIIHGSPFDRGCSDAYYYREPSPHYWTNGNGRNGGRVETLTDEQEEEYWIGYQFYPGRR
jgi:hypothetical protein